MEAFVCVGCTQTLRKQTIKVQQGKVTRHTWPGVRSPQKPLKRPQAFTPKGQEKRFATFPTPGKTVSQALLHHEPVTSHTTDDFRTQACKYLANYQYLPACRVLLKNSKAAKAAMVKVVAEEVRREVTSVTKQKRKEGIETLKGELTLSRLSQFSWEGVCLEAETKLPTMTTIMKASLPSAAKVARSVVVGPKGNRR